MKKIKSILIYLILIAITLIFVTEAFYKITKPSNFNTGDYFDAIQNDTNIKVVGNIEYKHIFKQDGYGNGHLKACLPFQKKSKADSSVFLSFSEFGGGKVTKFTIAYDSCTVSAFDELFIKPWKYEDIPYEYISYIVRQDSAALIQWHLDIEKMDESCPDTDITRVKFIKEDGSFIEFSQLYNVIIEELDLNHDGFTEVYLFSYEWCQCAMDVYRINIKR